METGAHISKAPTLDTDSAERAYQQGYNACVLGARIEENPYAQSRDSSYRAWHEGWLAAFKVVYGQK
jgi:ribosome modulation factor